MVTKRPLKVLIFIVAYNAEATLTKVLNRIPGELFDRFCVEVLVIDDASQDMTYEMGLSRALSWDNCPITILQNPRNQGYGGNQKLGYDYAIKKGFNVVALLHGDGQYAPEILPRLIEPVVEKKADAVFGSRMMTPWGALKGGMPLYKFIGNKILSKCQNFLIKTRLSEFHSGYRVYSTEALSKIPFKYNSNYFDFDTDIILQLTMAGLRIEEIPIPTYYGDEICYVEGVKYAKKVISSTVSSRLHLMSLKYQRKFAVEKRSATYDIKVGYKSSHQMAIDAVPPGSSVLDLGCGEGLVANELVKKSCHIVGLDQYPPETDSLSEFIEWDLNNDTLPEEARKYEYILALDIVEHLRNPEGFMDMLREGAKLSTPTIILTTPNIAFFITRFMLLAGQFNYGKTGILDLTHTRLFTFTTMKDMLTQSGHEILDVRGIPAPFPKAVKSRWLGKLLLNVNDLLITLSKNLFSYQMFFIVRPLPTVDNLLNETILHSKSKAKKRQRRVRSE